MELGKEVKTNLEFQLENLSGQIEEYYDYGIQDEITNNIESRAFHIGEVDSLQNAEELYHHLTKNCSAFDKIIHCSNAGCPGNYLDIDDKDYCSHINNDKILPDIWLSHATCNWLIESYSSQCFYCWLRVLCPNQEVIDKVWNILSKIPSQQE